MRVTTKHAETFSIRRAVKRSDLLGIELSNPAPRSAIDKLDPDIIHAVFGDGISNCLPIRSELHTFGNSRIGLQETLRTQRGCIQQDDMGTIGIDAPDA